MVKYLAQFHKNSNNQYEVYFPDLEPYAPTYGNTFEEALQSAHDSLTGYLLTQKDFHEKVPSPTHNIKKINIPSSDFLVSIQVEL